MKKELLMASQGSNSHPYNHQTYAQPTNHYMFHDNPCTHVIITHVPQPSIYSK